MRAITKASVAHGLIRVLPFGIVIVNSVTGVDQQ